jgi:hypothetical protein
MTILLARSPIRAAPVIASSEAVHLSTRNLLEGLTARVVQSAVSPARGGGAAAGSRRVSGGGTVDCFAMLAMTAKAPARSSLRLSEVGRCAPRAVSDRAYNVVFKLCL